MISLSRNKNLFSSFSPDFSDQSAQILHLNRFREPPIHARIEGGLLRPSIDDARDGDYQGLRQLAFPLLGADGGRHFVAIHHRH